jgi:hypothetical protein
MDINTAAYPWDGLIATVAADLTEAAYPLLLRHGTVDSWVDLELELWRVLSERLQRIGNGLFRNPGESNTQRNGRPTEQAEPEQTKAMLERLVTYYGLGEDGEPTSHRFLSYKIIAGPGPTEDSGLATITTLALNNLRDCEYCQRFHIVERGGAAAALAAAIRYLDVRHAGDRLRKVESDVRG